MHRSEQIVAEYALSCVQCRRFAPAPLALSGYGSPSGFWMVERCDTTRVPVLLGSLRVPRSVSTVVLSSV